MVRNKRRATPAQSGQKAADRSVARTGKVIPCVVGIGASAGGFEAIRALLSAMPADSGLAFVVVQHLDPGHKSMAAELLAPHTALTVVQASDGLDIKANHVYTVPPGAEAGIVNQTLRLTPRVESERPHLPVDRLFRTLAEELKEKAIGVVLSGTGSDGSIGALSIAAEGGIVLVQEPASARHDGMPRSVIATGAASDVLPVESMPEVLIGYAHHPYVLGEEPGTGIPGAMQTAALRSILDALQRVRGQSFHGYKRATLLRRIQRRMGMRQLIDLARYADIVRSDAKEAAALNKDLLIGVTQFFRDSEAWEVLARDALIPLVHDKADAEPIRVWIAGTGTGEEAYSLTMLLLEVLRDAGKACPLRVFATDTNEDAIAFARTGRYPAGIADEVPAERLQRYFVPQSGERAYRVTGELRECITFGVQDLATDPPFSGMDLICCRNVLIYLQPELQRDIIRTFHFALRTGGYLFLGTAESTGTDDDRFDCLSQKWKIFRRVAAHPGQRTTPRDRRLRAWRPAALLAPGRGMARATTLPTLVQRLLLERYSPAAVVVDNHRQILYFSGETSHFLAPPKGAPTQNILEMAREGLRSRLRSALSSAAENGTEVHVDDAHVRLEHGNVPVQFTIAPLPESASGDYSPAFLVVFREGSVPTATAGRPTAAVRRLENELQLARDDLQSTIEDLRASNLELKFSNEEVMSANEELQAMNEELESSKEELQSLNEELNTSNQQLEDKLAELATANRDLRNLLDSSKIATICLDADMNLRWYTPAATEVVSLRPTDIARPIGEIAMRFSGEPLLARAREVIGSLKPVEDELQAKDLRWFIRRTIPYMTDDGRADGVIITLTDITEVKRAAVAAIEEKQALIESLAARIHERTRELEALATSLSMAEERERQAVAADLHDELAQILALAKIRLHELLRDPQASSLAKPVEQVTDLLDRADRRTRSLATQLSNPVLRQFGLVAALESLAEEMQHDYDIRVDFRDDGKEKKLAPAAEIVLYRAVRELLINVAKHADTMRANMTCRVEAHAEQRTLTIMVSDNGRGFSPSDLTVPGTSRPGMGLQLIRERLQLLGGTFSIASIPGDGVEAILSLPLPLPLPLPPKNVVQGNSS